MLSLLCVGIMFWCIIYVQIKSTKVYVYKFDIVVHVIAITEFDLCVYTVVSWFMLHVAYDIGFIIASVSVVYYQLAICL